MPRQRLVPGALGMDLGDTNYKVYGPKDSLSEFVDLSGIRLQVNGPLVHSTLETLSLHQILDLV